MCDKISKISWMLKFMFYKRTPQNKKVNTTTPVSFKLMNTCEYVNYYSGIKREKGPMYYFLR